MRNRIAGLAAFVALILGISFFTPTLPTPRVSASDEGPFNDPVTRAMFVRTEFFGSTALVPLPPSVARRNLLELTENDPSNTEALLKIAGIDEQTGDYEAAEEIWKRLIENDRAYLSEFAAFLNRRGRFEEYIAVLETRFVEAKEPSERSARLGELLEAAALHDVRRYFGEEFFEAHKQALTAS
ncbi:MAG: hypothetical protein J5I65_07570, partial [Aridibacter famidurans]|nr:hypothetical protein [Aridibacter famidurans]